MQSLINTQEIKWKILKSWMWMRWWQNGERSENTKHAFAWQRELNTPKNWLFKLLIEVQRRRKAEQAFAKYTHGRWSLITTCTRVLSTLLKQDDMENIEKDLMSEFLHECEVRKRRLTLSYSTIDKSLYQFLNCINCCRKMMKNFYTQLELLL